jgi:hypothetical protein
LHVVLGSVAFVARPWVLAGFAVVGWCDVVPVCPTVPIMLGVVAMLGVGLRPSSGSGSRSPEGRHFGFEILELAQDLGDVIGRSLLRVSGNLLRVGGKGCVILTGSGQVVLVGSHEAANEILQFLGGRVGRVAGVAGSSRASAVENFLGCKEVGLEVGPAAIGVWPGVPRLAFVVVETAVENAGVAGVNNVGIRNGPVGIGREFLDGFEMGNEVLEATGRIPRLVEALPIQVDLHRVEMGVVIEQMLEHLAQRDLGESTAPVADALEVDGSHGGGEFLLESTVKVVVLVPLTKGFFVATLGG